MNLSAFSSSKNPKYDAALRLGFYSRYLGIDCIQDVLIDLTEDVHPNVFAALQRLLGEMFASSPPHDHEAEERQIQLFTFQLPPFRDAADKAFRKGTPEWKWYDLGRLLGECAECKTLQSEIEYHRIEQCIGSLMDNAAEHLSVLQKLAHPNAERPSAATIIESLTAPQKITNTTLYTWNKERSKIVTFFDLILCDLRNTRLPTASHDPAAEERDKWLYEQWRDGQSAKEIALAFKQMPKDWDRIESSSGIRAAVNRYSRRHNLAPLPKRKLGRPRQ